MKSNLLLLAIFAAYVPITTKAFPSLPLFQSRIWTQAANLGLKGDLSSEDVSRREFVVASMAFLVGSAISIPSSANAVTPQQEVDKANILKGYQRLQFLLDNWEKVCFSRFIFLL